jgi:hypothetical protein
VRDKKESSGLELIGCVIMLEQGNREFERFSKAILRLRRFDFHLFAVNIRVRSGFQAEPQESSLNGGAHF